MGQAASVLSGDEAGAPAARVGSYFAALSRATTRAAAFARAAAPASSAPPATASTHLGGSDSSSAPGVPPAPNLHPSATVSALAGAGRGAQGALSDALKLAMEGAGGRNPALAGVEALAGAVEEAGAWLRTLPEALGVGDVAGEGAQAFLLAALDVALPVLRGVKGYGALERAALQAEVGACLGRAAHADPETFAAAVPGAVREAGAALRAATSRCHAATGMTEGAGMLTAVDAAFVEMCLRRVATWGKTAIARGPRRSHPLITEGAVFPSEHSIPALPAASASPWPASPTRSWPPPLPTPPPRCVCWGRPCACGRRWGGWRGTCERR